MHIALITCAESVSVDQTSNNISAINIIEAINAPAFPIALPLNVVAIFRRKPTETSTPTCQLRVFISTQKEPIFDSAFPINFQKKFGARGVGRIPTLIIPGPGTLSVVMQYKKKNLGTWTIRVRETQQRLGPPPLERSAISASRPRKKASKKKRK